MNFTTGQTYFKSWSRAYLNWWLHVVILWGLCVVKMGMGRALIRHFSGERPFGRSTRRWADNIERGARDIDLQETWTERVRDRTWWRVMVILALSSRTQCIQNVSWLVFFDVHSQISATYLHILHPLLFFNWFSLLPTDCLAHTTRNIWKKPKCF